MTTFLVWNVQKKSLDGLIVRLVQQHDIHVLILIERPEFDSVLLQALRTQVSPRPGTYYHNGSGVHEVFWHMIDQVVVRPDLLPRFHERRLRVLRSAGTSNFLTLAGLPGAKNGSDHLPIFFDLQLRGATRA